MHRRLAAAIGALALALGSVGTVSADTIGPSGSFFGIDWTSCHGTVCTDASLEIDLPTNGTAQACLRLADESHSDFGCTTDLGAVTFSGKFIVGISETSISVPNFGTYTVSASTALSGKASNFRGCSFPDSWHGKIVDVSGTLTVNGESGAAVGDSRTQVARTVKKC